MIRNGLIFVFIIILLSSNIYSKDFDCNKKNEFLQCYDSSKTYLLNQRDNSVSNGSKKPINYLDFIIPIIVALIAASIAILQVKMNIINSARIQWIENLRKQISTYITEVDNLHV